MIKVLCCIQARVGSQRLPGKVMKKICDKTLIVHIIDRLKLCRKIDKLVLATSRSKIDDILAKAAYQEKIDVFRGSENNVLERFYGVMCEYESRHIVRVCADNPLIDPVEVDKIIVHHIKKRADYSFNHIPAMENNYPDGVGAELFKTSVLKEIAKNKQTTLLEKEHINDYIWNHPEQYHIETIKASKEIAYPQYRFEVNTEEDLKFIRKIYKKLYRGEYFSTRDVIACLEVKEAKLA